MAEYKATGDLSSKDTYLKVFHAFRSNIGIEKTKNLLEGGSTEITDFDSLPESVKEHLEPIETKVKKKKGVK
mgnify:CR=1 FL=1